jgi:hypothetical protein
MIFLFKIQSFPWEKKNGLKYIKTIPWKKNDLKKKTF